jgi:hypothetical protein
VSGDDHYAAAEALLRRKAGGSVRVESRHSPDRSRPPTADEIAQAQAHAMLALVNVAEQLLAELAMLREQLTAS